MTGTDKQQTCSHIYTFTLCNKRMKDWESIASYIYSYLSICSMPGTNGSSCEGIPEQHACDNRRRQTSQPVTRVWAIRQRTQLGSCPETASLAYPLHHKQHQQRQRRKEGDCRHQVWWVPFTFVFPSQLNLSRTLLRVNIEPWKV